MMEHTLSELTRRMSHDFPGNGAAAAAETQETTQQAQRGVKGQRGPRGDGPPVLKTAVTRARTAARAALSAPVHARRPEAMDHASMLTAYRATLKALGEFAVADDGGGPQKNRRKQNGEGKQTGQGGRGDQAVLVLRTAYRATLDALAQIASMSTEAAPPALDISSAPLATRGSPGSPSSVADSGDDSMSASHHEYSDLTDD